jgi:cytoskeletal protein RodZ
MSDLGTILKEAREERGISLREIATTTKISVVALEALERSDYSRLPGGIFDRSFVRAYALAVGVDPESAVRQLLEELAVHKRNAELNAKRPQITKDDREFLDRQRQALRVLRTGLVLAAVVTLVLLVYVGWIWWPGE